MSAVGIIAEFNPLHKGHEYLLKEAKKHGTVVCVLSGNFVQRGDTAVVDKRVRAKMALECGADVVLELPVCWSMSTAQNFALGGVSLLKEAGCDKIIFGSECGNIEKLLKTAEILISKEFSSVLEKELKKGVTFAAAREKAAVKLGAEKGILSKPNNNLAIEYIIAAKTLGYTLEFLTVKRKGADHDSTQINEFVSASLLREWLYNGDFDSAKAFMSQKAFSLLNANEISDIKRLETAILAVLRTKTLEELSKLPDVSEGLHNKLFAAIRTATTLEEVYGAVKVKRYTLARIRRIVLSAFLGLDNTFFMKSVPYLRVLGFNKAGEKFLKGSIKKSTLPIIVRAADIKKASADAQTVFETEAKATDLFALSTKVPLVCGLEYTAKLIKEN